MCNLIKHRVIPLFLTFVVLISMMAFPAFADETVSGLNLLEVATPNDSGSFTSKHTETTSDIWQLPFETNVNYIDMVVRVTGATINGVNVSADSYFGSYPLGFLEIQPGLYRIFGPLGGQETDYLRIKFSLLNSTPDTVFFVTYRQFSIDTKPYVIHDIHTYGYLDDYNDNGIDTQKIWYDGYAQQYTLPASSAVVESFLASWIFEPEDWLKYDFIEVAFASTSQGFTGIGATLGLDTLVVPVEYNVVSQASTDYRDSLYIGSVRIDLRNIDRVKYYDSTLSLRISAGKTYNQVNTYSIQSIKGFVFSEQPTGISALFINLKAWLLELGDQFGRNINFAYIRVVEAINNGVNTIVNALGVSGDTGELEDSIDDILDQMQDANDAMNELDRPPADEVISNVDLDIGEGSAFFEIMGSFFQNEFLLSIISGSLAFSVFGLLVG